MWVLYEYDDEKGSYVQSYTPDAVKRMRRVTGPSELDVLNRAPFDDRQYKAFYQSPRRQKGGSK